MGGGGRGRVYLGDLQQYDAVLDGLYHALEGDRQQGGVGVSHGQETRQGELKESYCEGAAAAFHLHMWFLLNFQFSVEKEKKKKTGC